MLKRTWIVIMAVLGVGVLLSACGGGELAEKLTPIPTLPAGQEPTLVDDLQAGTATPAEVAGDQGEPMDQTQLVAMGEQLFSGSCTACHGEKDGAGPSFVGMADRAATREPGKTAEQYLHEAIIDPSAYVVDGFSDIMPKNFGQQFSDQELNALVAYIVAKSGGEAETEAGTPTEAAATEVPTEAPASPEAASATPAAAQPAGDAANGETLFASTCSGCHGAQDGAGPALKGMGERAATRVSGMSAADYLHESIVDPSAFVVSDFSDIMPKSFGQQFSAQEINDLVAYILTQ